MGVAPSTLAAILAASAASDPAQALLDEARIYVDWSDAASRAGRIARNQNAPVPSSNLVMVPTGRIVNESGSGNPPRTNNYVSWTDADGTTSATRILSTAANQVLYIVRSGQGPMPPAGTYTLRFRARANGTTGPWTINYGPSNSYTSGSVQALDWTQAGNKTATTFEVTFSYNGTSDIAVRFAASGSDVLIDRLQIYEGSSAPSWALEVFGGGRMPYAFGGSIPLDADGNADLTGVASGLTVVDPAFPAQHMYSGYTVLTVQSLDGLPASASMLANVSKADGGSTTADVLISDFGAPYDGEVWPYAAGPMRSSVAANLAGVGIFLAGYGRGDRGDGAQGVYWLDAIPAVVASYPFAGLNIARWTIGGWASTLIAGARTNLAPGTYCYTVVWDRLLTDAEFAAVVTKLRGDLDARGVTRATWTDYHVISGDSNSTRADGDWTQLVTARGYISGQRDMYASITSVGGQGLDNILTGGSGTLDPVSTVGRYWLQDRPALLGAVEDGRYALYHLPIGTNDWDLIGTYGTSAYLTALQGFITAVLAEHARIHVMWYSLLPQNEANAGRESWESWRATINAAMATWISGQSRVHLCDFGGSATIGDRSLQDAGGGTYYLSDEIHLAPAGDVEAAAISGAAVAAWRTSLGIA